MDSGIRLFIHISAPGPDRVCDVALSAVERWRADSLTLPETKPYRPKTLGSVAALLDAAPVAPAPASMPVPAPVVGRDYTVRRGDALRSIALKVYGHADEAGRIFEANRAILDDPDRIYVGQILFVPDVGR